MAIHICVVDAGAPLEGKEEKGSNDYSHFDCVKGYKGVYAFQCKNTGEILYVGEAGAKAKAKDRYLPDRVKQHYSRGKTGGNFPINWRSINCSECRGDRDCDGNGGCQFTTYEDLLRNSIIIFFCFDDKCTPVESIFALEYTLKFLFLPKYDKEIMEMNKGNMDVMYICNAMQLIANNEMKSCITEGYRYTEQTSIIGHIDGSRHKISYILRLLAAGMSPVGMLANHLALSEEDLSTVKAFVDAISERSDANSV